MLNPEMQNQNIFDEIKTPNQKYMLNFILLTAQSSAHELTSSN